MSSYPSHYGAVLRYSDRKAEELHFYLTGETNTPLYDPFYFSSDLKDTYDEYVTDSKMTLFRTWKKLLLSPTVKDENDKSPVRDYCIFSPDEETIDKIRLLFIGYSISRHNFDESVCALNEECIDCKNLCNPLWGLVYLMTNPEKVKL